MGDVNRSVNRIRFEFGGPVNRSVLVAALISIVLTDHMYVSSGFRLPSCYCKFQILWSGAAGDIWPTGPMLSLSYIPTSTANVLELLQVLHKVTDVGDEFSCFFVVVFQLAMLTP